MTQQPCFRVKEWNGSDLADSLEAANRFVKSFKSCCLKDLSTLALKRRREDNVKLGQCETHRLLFFPHNNIIWFQRSSKHFMPFINTVLIIHCYSYHCNYHIYHKLLKAIIIITIAATVTVKIIDVIIITISCLTIDNQILRNIVIIQLNKP